MILYERWRGASFLTWGLALLFLCAAPLVAQPPLPEAPRVGLFDSVATVLTRYWPDVAKRKFIVEPLIAEHAARAAAAQTFGEEYEAVQALLRKIPSSHLGLMSASAYRSLSRALRSEREYMFGMQLLRWDGRWYAAAVYDEGPAHRAGIRAWDEIVAIDGVAPDKSGRLDFSTDDAYLTDDRDPPMHTLLADTLSSARFRVRSAPDSVRELDLLAEPYSAWEGSATSLRVIEHDGLRIGYLHLFYMYMQGGADWLSDRFTNEWANVDALVLDLRGRGGDGALANYIADVIGGSGGRWRRYTGPVVALQDRQTRSAKEILLDRIRSERLGRLVGEPSAGAVVFSTARDVGHDMVLMMPAAVFSTAPEDLDLRPVQPDVLVAWGGPFSGRRDPILAAGLDEVVRLASVLGRGKALAAPVLENKFKPTLKVPH
jgi:tricorn protease